MKIISIEFAKNPNAEKEYGEAIIKNKDWVSEINNILKVVVRTPAIGTKGVFLPKGSPDFDIHDLSKQDNSYNKIKARGARLTKLPNRGSLAKKDRGSQKFVFTVYPIETLSQLYAHRESDRSSLFSIKLDKIGPVDENSITLNQYGIILIVEVGGHYKYKNKDIDPKTASSLDEFGFSQEDHKILDDIVDNIGKESR